MKFAKMNLQNFSNQLASDSAAPGGGSASALTGALGISLTSMVCGLTIGKKKYEESEVLMEQTRTKALSIKNKLLMATDKDSEAFYVIANAYKMPKENEEEKQLRSMAIQDGLIGCIESPLMIMELSLEGLKLISSILHEFNQSAASDLGVSALMLKASLQGAWFNVRINLRNLKDKDKVNFYESKAHFILEDGLLLSDEILNVIELKL